MKKIFTKSLSILLAVITLFTAIPMLVSAEDAVAPEFTVEKVNETETSLELVLKLTSGSFACFDTCITVKGLTCTAAYTANDFDAFVRTLKKNNESAADCENIINGKSSVSVTESCTAPMDILVYEFSKPEKTGVNGSDVSLTFDFCCVFNSEGKEVEVTESVKASVGLPETHVHTNNGKWVTTVPAKCTVDGKEELYCTECGALVDSRTIEHTGHLHTHEVVVEPLCTVDGYRRTVCDDCNSIVSEVSIPASGVHPSYRIEQKAATCKEDGYVRYYCTKCGDLVQDNVLPAGHKLVTIVTDADCRTSGSKVTKCSVCGEVFSTESIPRKSHKWTEWKTVKEATTTSTGLMRRTCIYCGDYDDKVIPMIKVDPTGLKLSMNELSMNYKKTLTLYANILPEDAVYTNTIIWESSNTKVATVDQDGNVTAKGPGTATITAKTEDGQFSDTCNVTVSYTWLQYIIIYVLFGWIWY